jgi:hypothetical protein
MARCPGVSAGDDGAQGPYLFRSAATAGFIESAFDPDNGKNQNGCHAFAGSAIHA